jgi:hypothetical protein
MISQTAGKRIGFCIIVLMTMALGQDIQRDLVLTNGANRVKVEYGDGILVYDHEGELAASGTYAGLSEGALVVEGSYRHQVPLTFISKLVLGPERTTREDLSRRLKRAVVFEVLFVAALGSLGSGSGEGGIFLGFIWGVVATTVHGIQAVRFVGAVLQNSFSPGYNIGLDDWQLVLFEEQP